MAKKWGKADFAQLKQLEERLAKLEQTDFDAFCRAAAADIAERLLRAVKKRTHAGVVPEDLFDKRNDTVQLIGKPRMGKHGRMLKPKKYRFFTKEAAIYQQYWKEYKGGTLRDAWTVQPVEKVGDSYVVTVVNNTEYASYVEFGHRQKPGRYVPALGKSLTANWVEGQFMLTISEEKLRSQLPRILEKKVYMLLKEVF